MSVVKDFPANAGDTGSIRRSERPAGEGNSNPLQYSCLGNPMNRETWWARAHGVTKELDMTEQLNNNTTNSTHTHTHTHTQFIVSLAIMQSFSVSIECLILEIDSFYLI